MGFCVSVVLGSPKYYPRHGYVPATKLGILAPFEGMDEYYMACVLNADVPVPQGTVSYDPAFGL